MVQQHLKSPHWTPAGSLNATPMVSPAVSIQSLSSVQALGPLLVGSDDEADPAPPG